MSTELDTRRAAIEDGGDPDARDALGRTALHLAIAEKDAGAVGFLLDQGADWELKDNQGRPPTAVMYAEERKPWGIDFKLKRGYKPILGLLQEAVMTGRGSLTFLNQGDLFNAVLDGRVASVQDALDDAGVWDVNVQLEDGSTALHLAVEGGHARVVAALLEHHKELVRGGQKRIWPGPDLGLRTRAGETPLDVARRVGDPKILALLEAYAARTTPVHEPVAPGRDPDAIVTQVLAATQAILEQAHELEGLPLPAAGLTLVADEVSCAAVVVAADPWTAPFDGHKVHGRFVTEAQTLAIAQATGVDPLEALDRLLHRVAARLRRDGATFLEPGAPVVWVEHGGLEPDRAASAAAEAALDVPWMAGGR